MANRKGELEGGKKRIILVLLQRQSPRTRAMLGVRETEWKSEESDERRSGIWKNDKRKESGREMILECAWRRGPSLFSVKTILSFSMLTPLTRTLNQYKLERKFHARLFRHILFLLLNDASKRNPK